jgi:ferric-dicitrate binding protein FerR (iron transport regulator)
MTIAFGKRITAAYLTTHQRNIAHLAGGKISSGLRVALEFWLDSHPEIKRAYREHARKNPTLTELDPQLAQQILRSVK